MRTIFFKAYTVASLMIIVSCDLSTTPASIQDERAASVASLDETEAGSTTVTTNENDSQSLSAQSLAITSTMSQELTADLLVAGFSEEESQVIVNKASESATISANNLAVFSLTTSSPVLNEIAPAFIKGAMEGLSLAGNGLSSSTEKASATELVMTSSMTSLKTHTQGWSSSDRDLAENNLIEAGIQNVQLSGIDESNYKDAVFSVVKGTMSALEESGVAHDDFVSTTERLVEKSAEVLKSAPASVRVESMSQVSKGSVVGVGSLPLKDEERELIPSQVAVLMTSVTHSLALSDDDFSSAVSSISYQTGVGIKGVGLLDQDAQVKAMENLAAGVSSKIVEVSTTASSPQSFLEKIVPSVSAGVIQSMDSGLMTGANIVASGVSGKIIAKTLGSLKTATLDAEKKISLAGEVTSKAVSAAGAAKIDDGLQSSVIADIVKGSASSLEGAGLTEKSDLQSAVGLVASKAVEAMSSTSVPKESYGSATGSIVSSAISGMSKNVDVGSSIQSIAEKSMRALSVHQQDGRITSDVLKEGAKEATSSVIQEVKTMQNNGVVESKETEKFAVIAASGVVSGLAVGGVSSAETASVRDQVVDQMGSDLANIGVASDKVDAIKISANDKTDDAVEVAQILSDNSSPSCSLFVSTVSDHDFKTRVDAQDRDQVFCTAATVCPADRKIEGDELSWVMFSVEKSLCQMERKTIENDAVALTGGDISLSTIASSSVSFQVASGNLTDIRYKLVSDQDACLSRSLYSSWEAVQDSVYTLNYSLVAGTEYFLCVDGKRNFQLFTDSQISSASVIYVIPPSPPTLGSNPIVIDEGSYTNVSPVTLTLSASDADEMMITTDSSCASGTWEPYATTASRPVAINNNINTFYVAYKNAAGTTACSSASIRHDNQKPVFATGLSVTNQSVSSVPMAWSVSDAGSGVAEYQVSIGHTSGSDDVASWEIVTSTSTYTINNLSLIAGSYYANIKVKDNAGNEENSSIQFSLAGPADPTIEIETNATYTNYDPVSLNLGATGASQMYITNTAGCLSGGVWETYVATKSGWNLESSQLNNTATVYVKYLNAQGIESTCVSDSIIHDSIVPASPSIVIDDGTHTSSSSVNLTLGASGASEMYVTNTSTCNADGSWEAYSTSKVSWPLGQTNAVATVYVKYKDAAGNVGQCVNASVTHDNSGPSSPSIVIDGGSYTSDATPDLTLSVIDATEMYITNTAGCSSNGSWESYSTSKAGWTLGQTNAAATVYVKYKDAAGNESICVNDAITHDSMVPTGATLVVDGVNGYVSSNSVSLTLSATDVSSMYMYVTNDGTCSTGGSWEAYSATKSSWILDQTNAVATVYVKYKDESGNESSCVSGSVTHDSISPSSPSIVIDGGEDISDSTPDLTLSAVDATQMYITNTSGCAGGGVWESYATTKTGWFLGQSDALATVYAKYKDEAGNETSCIQDTVTHDAGAPTGASLVIDGGTHTSDSTPDLTLNAVGATEMYITNTLGCSAGGSWEAYSTSKTGWALSQTNAVATVYVKYKDAAGNESTCVNDAITHDSMAPTSATLVVDSGNTYTSNSTPDLTLSAVDATEMYITNTLGCSAGGSWETYSTSKASWSLGQSNGLATVYVKYKDEAGNETACVNDAITHDDTGPTGGTLTIDEGTHTNGSNINLTLFVNGASEMKISENAGCSGGTWEAYTTNKAKTLASSEMNYHFSVKYKDEAENISACSTDSIEKDNTAPTLSSFAIGSDEYTNSTSVYLNITSSGSPTEVYVTTTAGCSSGGSWLSTTAPVNTTLSGGDGSHTLYAKVKDAAGNESSCLSDVITLDQTSPSLPTVDVSRTQYIGHLRFSNFNSADTSGIDKYEVSIGTSSSGADIKDWEDIVSPNTYLDWVEGTDFTGDLIAGNTYYLNVKAVDQADNSSAVFTHTFVARDFVTEIHSGTDVNCVVSDDKTKCWGVNGQGQLGIGSASSIGDGPSEMGSSLSSVDLGTDRTVSQISMTVSHTCAVLDNQQLKCWGFGSGGGLGYGNTAHLGDGAGEMGDNLASVDLGPVSTVQKVSTGLGFSCAILTDNKVKCWGWNTYGQLGLGVNSHIGDILSEMGANLAEVNLGTGRTAQKLALGSWHTCALLDNNEVKCWGRNDKGQLGQGNTNHIGDGAGEMGDALSPVDLGAGRTATDITVGDEFSCALLDNNEVKCWGSNTYGQLGVGDTASRGHVAGALSAIDFGSGFTAEKIAAGGAHACAISTAGELKCWGENDDGELGLGTNSSVGDSLGEMGASLSVVDLGSFQGVNEKVESVSIGRDHTCAVLKSGPVKCWGKNSNGSLGKGDNVGPIGDISGEMGNNLSPVQIHP